MEPLISFHTETMENQTSSDLQALISESQNFVLHF